jgi:hypothetical protein
VTLKVDTIAPLQIAGLRLYDIKASALKREIELDNVTLRYEVFNISLSELGIEAIQVPQLEVG